MKLILLIITAAISIIAFSNEVVMRKLIHNPWMVHHRKEYWRLISSGFIHADWMHLLINMFVLFGFGFGFGTAPAGAGVSYSVSYEFDSDSVVVSAGAADGSEFVEREYDEVFLRSGQSDELVIELEAGFALRLVNRGASGCGLSAPPAFGLTGSP